jgi:hypothetical protein
MSHRGWLTQAWNYHQSCIDTLLLSYSGLTLANAHFPDVNVVLQIIHATLHCYFRLGDAKGPLAVEYRLAGASSLGARVLSKQIRSAFVPILYLSPIAK